jgi:hypothetical protein
MEHCGPCPGGVGGGGDYSIFNVIPNIANMINNFAKQLNKAFPPPPVSQAPPTPSLSYADSPPSVQQQTKILIDQGQDAYDHGDYAKAEDFYRQAAAIDPAFLKLLLDPLIRQGNEALDKGEYIAAVNYYLAAKQWGDNRQIEDNLARAQALLNQQRPQAGAVLTGNASAGQFPTRTTGSQTATYFGGEMSVAPSAPAQAGSSSGPNTSGDDYVSNNGTSSGGSASGGMGSNRSTTIDGIDWKKTGGSASGETDTTALGQARTAATTASTDPGAVFDKPAPKQNADLKRVDTPSSKPPPVVSEKVANNPAYISVNADLVKAKADAADAQKNFDQLVAEQQKSPDEAAPTQTEIAAAAQKIVIANSNVRAIEKKKKKVIADIEGAPEVISPGGAAGPSANSGVH